MKGYMANKLTLSFKRTCRLSGGMEAACGTMSKEGEFLMMTALLQLELSVTEQDSSEMWRIDELGFKNTSAVKDP